MKNTCLDIIWSSFQRITLLVAVPSVALVTMIVVFAAQPAQAQVTWQEQSDYIGASGGAISQARSLRGLALAPDEASLYGGFIQGSTSGGIRKVNSSVLAVGGSDSAVIGNGMGFGTSVNPNGNYPTNPYYGTGVLATKQTGGGASAFNQPKGVATDDRGNVYATLNSGANGVNQPWAAYNSSLTVLGTFTSTAGVSSQLSGLSLQKSGSDYYVYIARNNGSAQIERWNVTNPVTSTLDTTWGGGTGKINLRSRADWNTAECNGLEVDGDGTLYVTGGLTGSAGSKRDSVFKIPAAAGVSGDLTTGSVATVNGAMDVAIFQSRLVVSQYLAGSSTVAVLNKSDLSLVSTLTTGITHSNTASDSGYSGIAVSSAGKIYVVDQVYAPTSNSYTPPATSFNPSPQNFGSVSMMFDRILVSSVLPPMLQSVVSRMVHGGSGTFDLTLSTTSRVIEPRSAGNGNFTIVFNFDEPVNSGNATVTSGIGSVNSVTFSGNSMIVGLTGVIDQQTITLTATNISGPGTGTLPSVSLQIGFLNGDVNQDATVNVGDTVIVRNNAGSALDNTNFLSDLNVDGLVNVGDTVTVRARSGDFLTAAPSAPEKLSRRLPSAGGGQ
jgi:hypothetical protein